jgi:hypothetical protein
MGDKRWTVNYEHISRRFEAVSESQQQSLLQDNKLSLDPLQGKGGIRESQ